MDPLQEHYILYRTGFAHQYYMNGKPTTEPELATRYTNYRDAQIVANTLADKWIPVKYNPQQYDGLGRE